jgi:hypothetical protein
MTVNALSYTLLFVFSKAVAVGEGVTLIGAAGATGGAAGGAAGGFAGAAGAAGTISFPLASRAIYISWD